MKTKSLVIGILTLIAVAGITSGKSLKSGGTSILHFKVRAPLSPAADSSVGGDVNLNQNRQGNANNQRFDLRISGLTAGNTYYVLVTNLGSSVHSVATNFTADEDGSMVFRHMKVGSSKGKGPGKGKLPLPAAMDPLADIRGIAIAESVAEGTVGSIEISPGQHAVVVASADLSNPASTTYLVSRSLDTAPGISGAVGVLRIKANSNGGDFRLRASGLVSAATYSLVVNGAEWLTGTTDAEGYLEFNKDITVAEALAIQTIDVSDTTVTPQVILTTTLP